MIGIERSIYWPLTDATFATVVAEPGTCVLFAIGVALFMLACRRSA